MIDIEKITESDKNYYIHKGKALARETNKFNSFAIAINEDEYTSLLLADELFFKNNVVLIKQNGKIVIQDDEFIHRQYLSYIDYQKFAFRRDMKALTLALNNLNETLKTKEV